ncbi:MAG: hypothetical protein WAV51_02020 [Microgenomates group bacterium]
MSATQETQRYLKTFEVIPYIREYDESHITADGKFLEIDLAGQKFPLELRNVGGEENPIYIAWLDTHPDHKGVPVGLSHASAVERADLILEMVRKGQEVTTIVTPDSSKSLPSIKETVDIVSHALGKHINYIILPGGREENEVAIESAIAPIAYRNVTSGDADKFLGISATDLAILLRDNRYGKGILTIDDVYTTGGTDIAVQKILNTILRLPDTVRHPLVVLARESEYFGKYPHPAPDHVFSIIHLPEFTHGFHN